MNEIIKCPKCGKPDDVQTVGETYALNDSGEDISAEHFECLECWVGWEIVFDEGQVSVGSYYNIFEIE